MKKNIAFFMGIIALVALIPLLVIPYQPNKSDGGAPVSLAYAAAPQEQAQISNPDTVKDPLGNLRGYSKVSYIEPMPGDGEGDVKGQGPTVFASLALKQKIPTVKIATSNSYDSDLLSKIPEIEANYGSIIRDEAEKYGFSPALITAVIAVESEGNPLALSNKGARGLMQILPSTKNDIDSSGNLWDPTDNIRIGTAYLADLRDNEGFSSTDAMLVAYNMGPGNARELSTYDITHYSYAKKVAYILNNM